MDLFNNPEQLKSKTFIIDNNFKCVSLLGEGAMGYVVLALDLNLNRKVALKILKPQFNNELDLIERFKTEASCIAKLNHPNVVNIYNSGYDSENQLHYIVMEYIEGYKLSSLIESDLNFEQVLSIFYIIISALHYIHSHDIIHRDIKPANIMITHNNIVKLVDFGLAKDIGSSLSITKENDFIGTPYYLAPELWYSSKNISKKSDIYSLGVVIYECISKTHPYSGSNHAELFKNVTTRQYDKLSKTHRHIPLQFELLLASMLEKSINKRISTDELFQSFKSVISELGIQLKNYNIPFINEERELDLTNIHNKTTIFNPGLTFDENDMNLLTSSSKSLYMGFGIGLTILLSFIVILIIIAKIIF